MADNKVICLWSGGKDSCFATYKTKQAGLDIRYLVNFTRDNNKYSLSHNIGSRLLSDQMQALNIPFIQRQVKNASYEDCFADVVTRVKKEGIKSIVFGDIYLNEHRDWIEKFCKKMASQPIFPLWGISTKKIVCDFVKAGFRSVLVNVKKETLDKSWLGRQIDKNFIKNLAQAYPRIDPCGESGEFHTLVIDGPIFTSRIGILDTKMTAKDNYYSLEILNYEIVDKKG